MKIEFKIKQRYKHEYFCLFINNKGIHIFREDFFTLYPIHSWVLWSPTENYIRRLS